MKIKILLRSLAILTSVIIIGCSGAVSPQFGTYKSQISNQMQDMIDVLFAGHYSEFMSTYVSPSYISKVGGVDKAVMRFDNAEQQRLSAALKIAKNVTPFYDESKNEMSYVANALPKPITFKLISGKWYMLGDWFNN